MNALERLQQMEAKRKRKPELPTWLDSLESEQRSAFDEVVTAYLEMRRNGSKLGVTALIDIIENDCGRRWSEKTIKDYLRATYGHVWGA